MAALGGHADRGADGAARYKFGDVTRGVLAAGRVARGGDADRGAYKFGDATRGVLATLGWGRGGGDVGDARDAAAAVRESARANLDVVASHCDAFLADAGDGATYEAWLAALHPENVAADGTVDARFYLADSDHRRVWEARRPTAAPSASVEF